MEQEDSLYNSYKVRFNDPKNWKSLFGKSSQNCQIGKIRLKKQY